MISAISVTSNNISLIVCNPHNDKLLWIYIRLPKFRFKRTFLLFFTWVSTTRIVFYKSSYSFVTRPNLLLLSQKEFLIISITSTLLNIEWLANLCRWKILIDSLKTRWNMINSLQQLIYKCNILKWLFRNVWHVEKIK